MGRPEVDRAPRPVQLATSPESVERQLLPGAARRGHEPYRAVVRIFGRTSGGDVAGNRLWYLLTDGTWAWGSAKYIDTIGAAPRWC